MNTNDAITELRKKMELSQEDFAEKIHVTRQAVSRWETGETMPSVDTLKIIAETFEISVDHLLGHPSGVCQSCGMTLRHEDEMGTQKDGSKTDEYCVFCYRDGTFTHDYTLEEAIEHNIQMLGTWNEDENMKLSPEEARTQLREFLPTLKRWNMNA